MPWFEIWLTVKGSEILGEGCPPTQIVSRGSCRSRRGLWRSIGSRQHSPCQAQALEPLNRIPPLEKAPSIPHLGRWFGPEELIWPKATWIGATPWALLHLAWRSLRPIRSDLASRFGEELSPSRHPFFEKGKIAGLRVGPGQSLQEREEAWCFLSEATTAFGDPLSLTIPDPEHSVSEARYILLGVSSRGRLLVVAHTERGDHLRIVRARLAAPAERRDYEEE